MTKLNWQNLFMNAVNFSLITFFKMLEVISHIQINLFKIECNKSSWSVIDILIWIRGIKRKSGLNWIMITLSKQHFKLKKLDFCYSYVSLNQILFIFWLKTIFKTKLWSIYACHVWNAFYQPLHFYQKSIYSNIKFSHE